MADFRWHRSQLIMREQAEAAQAHELSRSSSAAHKTHSTVNNVKRPTCDGTAVSWFSSSELCWRVSRHIHPTRHIQHTAKSKTSIGPLAMAPSIAGSGRENYGSASGLTLTQCPTKQLTAQSTMSIGPLAMKLWLSDCQRGRCGNTSVVKRIQ